MPPVPSPSKKVKLVGYKNFVRHNPMSDKFDVQKFHHVEFYCGDATNTFKRFQWGLGLNYIGKSDQSTGNHEAASYVVQSGDVKLVFTAPYALETEKAADSKSPLPGFDMKFAHEFTQKHGLAVRALGIKVADAKEAYEISVKNGAVGVLEPKALTDKVSGKSTVMSEVKLYGDVVIRWMSGDFDGPFVPGYEEVESGPDLSIGIDRFDHCVGNVPKLIEAVEYVMGFTGFHEFSEFTAEDVGTVDSGLNSMVLSSNNEMVLIPVNEPTFGTKRKSQIQTYLEQNVGPGLQHMALKTNDIFRTLGEMRKRSYLGGFEFMPRPEKGYYERLPARIGDSLTEKQYKQIEELGLLVDKDDQGVLLQIFTKPLGDRPTVFFEIIERVGCMADIAGRLEQAAGCGGFGKGNFSELFKSIEEYEKTLNV
uniref:4-hydroxyphenylpyruvate dioxygenase n=1 Tax=Globisporangium ultimum (strain ATCC 200006 / CBS 805.95 / DAOM BR144) TaxID=431595 RepID=K3WDR9_GLOUD